MFKVVALLSVAISANVFASTLNVEEAKKNIITNYANLVHSTYLESLERAKTMQSDIQNFLANPGVVTMEVAKESWRQARAPYGKSEVYRFYNGPIDRDGGPEGLLNSWPLDEAYIDYVEGNPSAGIINNIEEFPVITKELIEQLNENDGEKNISTGYHAIEFLLWGQDFYDDSAGKRPFTDYVVGKGINSERRAAYLNVATELLIDNLESLVSEWEEGKDNFRKKFENQDLQVSLKNIFNGLVFMAGDELSGERMYVAYETQGQEDEHSCFSDMTHMDIQWNFWGLVDVLKETGILDLVKNTNPDLITEVNKSIEETNANLASIPQPFDQALKSQNGLDSILVSVESLEGVAAKLVKVAKELGVSIDY